MFSRLGGTGILHLWGLIAETHFVFPRGRYWYPASVVWLEAQPWRWEGRRRGADNGPRSTHSGT